MQNNRINWSFSAIKELLEKSGCQVHQLSTVRENFATAYKKHANDTLNADETACGFHVVLPQAARTDRVMEAVFRRFSKLLNADVAKHNALSATPEFLERMKVQLPEPDIRVTAGRGIIITQIPEAAELKNSSIMVFIGASPHTSMPKNYVSLPREASDALDDMGKQAGLVAKLLTPRTRVQMEGYESARGHSRNGDAMDASARGHNGAKRGDGGYHGGR